MVLRALTVGDACERSAVRLHVTYAGYSPYCHPLAMPGGDPSQRLMRVSIRHKI